MIVRVTEPTRVSLASSTRSWAPKPRMVSQIRWRMPPRGVMDQRPGVAEEHQTADPGSGDAGEQAIGARRRSGGEQPPDQQHGAEIKRDPRGAMHDGHHHRRQRTVDLQVGRERSHNAGRAVGHGPPPEIDRSGIPIVACSQQFQRRGPDLWRWYDAAQRGCQAPSFIRLLLRPFAGDWMPPLWRKTGIREASWQPCNVRMDKNKQRGASPALWKSKVQ